MMVLDECVPFPCDGSMPGANDQTIRWAGRARNRRNRPTRGTGRAQFLFGIVQGSVTRRSGGICPRL